MTFRKVSPVGGILILIAVTFLALMRSFEAMWRPFVSTYGSPVGMLHVYRVLKGRLDGYFCPLANGEVDKAMAAWKLPADEIPPEKLTPLTQRRDTVTFSLAEANVSCDYSILKVVLWGPRCCENEMPGIIQDVAYISAIGARVTVQIVDKNNDPVGIYTADIFAASLQQGYWGEPEYWYIRDIYPEDDAPLFWPYKHRIIIEPVPLIAPGEGR